MDDRDARGDQGGLALMRRFLIVTPLLFALSACASATTAAVNPIPLSGLPPVAGVQLVGARQALVDFLKEAKLPYVDLMQAHAAGPPAALVVLP